jgi:serine/threonine protein kinase
MEESLVAVRLRSLVHKKPWEKHTSECKKVRGERIKQGNCRQVWRACYTDPDGQQTIVVIKEVTRTAVSAWQEEHELECFRRLDDHRFRDHVIKLLRILHQVSFHDVANFIVMESGITTLLHIQRSQSWHGTGTVQAWMRSLARAVWACDEVQVMHRDIKPANCIMCLGQEASLEKL